MAEFITGSFKVHHPFLHTLLMGFAFQWGVDHGNVSLGFSFYTLIQMLILSATLAGAITYIRTHIKVKSVKQYRLAIILSFVYYGVLPIHAFFSISATKDILFAAFYLGFSLYLFRLVYEKEKLSVLQWILFFISGCLMLLFRKNAEFAFIPCIPIICLYLGFSGSKDILSKKKFFYLKAGGFLLVAVGVILTANIINKIMISALNAYDGGSRREASSIPLQQLARVASYERGTLDEVLYHEILLYIPEGSVNAYNPFCSDAVKNDANEQLLKSNYLNFLNYGQKC